MSEPPNIAVVVLDTLRKDHFDEHFDWLPGCRFENAWSPSHWTLPVHAALYTGRYPSEIGVHAERPILDIEDCVLAEHLQTAGYTTICYTSNIVVSFPFGFDRGFDQSELFGYHDRKGRHQYDPELFDWSHFKRKHQPQEAIWKYGLGVWKCLTSDCDSIRSLRYGFNLKFDVPAVFAKDGHSDMGAREVFQRLQERDVGSSEFLYLNLMEAHKPYQIPNSYKQVSDNILQFPGNPVASIDHSEDIDVDAIRMRYGNAVRYLSDVYRDIFDDLRTDYDYVITLADHGELLGEHGHLGHGSGIYPELTHVPLSVYSGEDDSTRDSSLVSLLDVHRTVLDLAGVEGAESRGRNLLNGDFEASGSDTEFLTEYHGITFPSKNREHFRKWAGSKFIIESYLQWRRGLVLKGYYGYDTIEGFLEQGVAPDDDPQAKIEALVETFDVLPRDTDDTELSTDIEQKLEDLGYMA